MHTELLNASEIKLQLNDNAAHNLKELTILHSVDSTNTYLIDQLPTNAASGRVVLAEHQTAGRGQRGRPWHSPASTNIYLSVLWQFDENPVGLSQACGVVLIHALQEYGITSGLTLKSPNDVLWQQQKLAGILCENFPGKNGLHNVVIGIGINTDMPATTSIDQAWTDISKITRTKTNRNQLAGLVLNSLLTELPRFAEQGLEPVIGKWEKYLS